MPKSKPDYVLAQVRISISPSADMVEGFLSAVQTALIGIPSPIIRSIVPSGERQWMMTLRVPSQNVAEITPDNS
jgi:hypothetical protein